MDWVAMRHWEDGPRRAPGGSLPGGLAREFARLAVMVALGGLGWADLQPAGASMLSADGDEFTLTPDAPGDQVRPDLAIGPDGGYLVWQDRYTDGDGYGISAQRLDRNDSSAFGAFRVNSLTEANQERARVALLPNGGAVFVWQGGPDGKQDIYARFVGGDDTFVGPETIVNKHQRGQQGKPAVAALDDGSVVICWESEGVDGDKKGVLARRFSMAGEALSEPFQVNQTIEHNQRTPEVAALKGGGFVVVWISEVFQGETGGLDEDGRQVTGVGLEIFHVDVFGRLYDEEGAPLGSEFRVSEGGGEPCANPSVAGDADGGFQVAWGQKDLEESDNSWEIQGRRLDSSGQPSQGSSRLNTYQYGDQFRPQVDSFGEATMVVWSSLGQDDAWEEVYGRVLEKDGTPVSDELRVNTTVAAKQIHPVLSGGASRGLVVWSSYVGGVASFDLFAQRYRPGETLGAPSAPYVRALSSSRLGVSWPEVDGYEVESYELWINGREEPQVVEGNHYVHNNLAPRSEHQFRLVYRLADGRRSPISDSVTATTWGGDDNFDGLPDNWQSRWWGEDPADWPGPQEDTDGDGAINLDEFLAGTDPTDPGSTLKTSIETTPQGYRLVWDTKAGGIYQVQISDNVQEWEDLGEPRFASGQEDSMLIDRPDEETFFRVIQLQ